MKKNHNERSLSENIFLYQFFKIMDALFKGKYIYISGVYTEMFLT